MRPRVILELKDGSKVSFTDNEAWDIIQSLLAQIDIAYLEEPRENAARAVAEHWQEVLDDADDERLRSLDLGSDASAIVANAVESLIVYSRYRPGDDISMGDADREDAPLAADGGSQDQEGAPDCESGGGGNSEGT